MGETFTNDLASLIGAMCNGTISADDAAQLNARLKSDPAARTFYNNYMFLHGELYSQHAAADVADELKIESRELEPAPRRNRWGSVLAIAAALFGVAAVSSWATYSV